MITSAQIRAARGLLDWSQADLASFAGIGTGTIHNIEHGRSAISEEMDKKIRLTFERAGVVLIGNRGVSFGEPSLKTIFGVENLIEVIHDVEKYVLTERGIIRISGLDEIRFRHALGLEFTDAYIKKINEIPRTDYRIITSKNYDDYRVPYAKYRILDQEFFLPTPTYIYGHKVVFILWQSDQIIVIENSELAYMLAKQFDYMWEQLKDTELQHDKNK
ncbi:MAG: helix-turn-helix domain-containing protein [Alphaproteobacteria bacterium]|jgi:transcriptional regulator with XRE-family HTH domain|nr:helix-turn-helix domain-containing protein [Candidatus Jidaibacter sp.]